MQSPINQPAENNSRVDEPHLAEIAGAGIRQSVEMLRAILGLKEQRMAMLTPPEGKSKDQLEVARESVHDRYDLAKAISFAPDPRV